MIDHGVFVGRRRGTGACGGEEVHATITLIEIEMYGKGDGGPKEGMEEWPEMSRRRSGVFA